MNLKFFAFAFISVLMAFSAGCATSSGRSQFVLVKSEPAGANIYDFDDNLLGQTPAIIELKRRKSQQLRIENSYEKIIKKLDGNYRWGRSGAGNLVFFGLAPIGWGLDYATGAAWELPSNVEVTFKNKVTQIKSSATKSSRIRVAVAPPITNHPNFSDSVGRKLVEKLKARLGNTYEVLDYDETLNDFENSGATYDHRVNKDSKIELYGRLKVDQVLFSHVHFEKDEVVVDSFLKNYSSDNPLEKFRFQFPGTHFPSVEKVAWLDSKSAYFYWLPNAVSFDYSSSATSLTVGTQDVDLIPYESDGFLGKASKYFSYLSLRRLAPMLNRPGWKYRLLFVPSFSLSLQDEVFPDTSYIPSIPNLAGYRAQRSHLDFGYGPSFTYSSRSWYLYFNIMPAVSYDKLEAENSSRSVSYDKTQLSLAAEFGVLYQLENGIHFRVFSRSVSVPEELWEKVLYDLTGSHIYIESASLLTAGISVGYTFTNSNIKILR